jgi:hypothetical protein
VDLACLVWDPAYSKVNTELRVQDLNLIGRWKRIARWQCGREIPLIIFHWSGLSRRLRGRTRISDQVKQ